MTRIIPRLILLGAVTGIFSLLPAAEFLVVTHSTSNGWSLQRAESVTINGNGRVRRAAAAAAGQTAWDAKAIGRLPNIDIDNLTAMRRAPDGSVFARQGASPDWFAVLPDNTKAQTPESASQLWASSAILVKRDKKDKTPEAVQPTELYGIIAGQDASAVAGSLATEPEFHIVPGVDPAQAFRNRLDLLPVVVKAFPSGVAADRVREHIRSSMSDLLKTWSQGDAPVTLLDQCLALAAASETAFSADPAQTALRKQVHEARHSLDRRVAILRALDAGEQSDSFLIAYRNFEADDKSFPDLSAARQKHLKASALAHTDAGEKAQLAGDYAGAIHHLRIAHWRDPQLASATNQLERTRLEVAQLSAQQSAEARRGIDPRSATQVQLQRRLLLADQYLADNKAAEAEAAIKEAEAIDKNEPRVHLLAAKLAVLRSELGSALALLDLYAGLAINQRDFEEGEKLRSSVEYRIESERKAGYEKLAEQAAGQRFASALDTASSGLKLDNEDPLFLYHSGVQACVLRKCDQAGPLLRRFLDITDSTGGHREERIATMRLLARAVRTEGTSKPVSGAVSWFSGTALSPGVFYDPVSLAFQPKVARVKGSKGLTVAYEWGGDGLLKSVHTRYEDKKMVSNIAKLAIAGAAASQGIGSTVGWKTSDRETNDFYFSYYDELPQVLRVDRENVITKSRTIPIGIPGLGMGGLGALGGMGGLGGLGGMSGGLGGLLGMGRAVPALGAGVPGLGGGGGLAGALSGLAGGNGGGLGSMMQNLGRGSAPGVGGFGGLAGFGGVGGAGALRALVAQQAAGAGTNPLAILNSMGLGGMGQLVSTQNTQIHADPAGGSSVGYLTLWNSPRLDTELAYSTTGKRAAVLFSGNSFFQPFVWDAIHLFEADYDEEGRVIHAWELDRVGAPRLEFTWEGRLLKQVVARPAGGGSAVYTRSLQYAGDKLMSETIHFNNKMSRIQYKYDKQGRITEAECEDDLSLDDRSRHVEFALDAALAERGRK